MFDTPQTEGEPLPEVETAATGNAKNLVPSLQEAADDLGVTVRIVDIDDWDHGKAKGVCKSGVYTTSSRSWRQKLGKITRISL